MQNRTLFKEQSQSIDADATTNHRVPPPSRVTGTENDETPISSDEYMHKGTDPRSRKFLSHPDRDVGHSLLSFLGGLPDFFGV